eukprot:scaffold156785_cov21-Tisochrysis_lutea.AAC.1
MVQLTRRARRHRAEAGVGGKAACVPEVVLLSIRSALFMAAVGPSPDGLCGSVHCAHTIVEGGSGTAACTVLTQE